MTPYELDMHKAYGHSSSHLYSALGKRADPKDFAEKFATGFLIGEVLKKHQLQDDFESFSQSRTADSKLNNFTRLEPTLHLLEIPFDTNTARDIMTEKPGVATRLMYQLYIALNNKSKADLTGVAMETMRPRAPVKLESMERGPYKERLKILTPRQTDLNLDQLVEKFRERKRQHMDVEFRTKYEIEEQQRQWQQEMRQKELEKASQARQARTELTARIKAATVEMPKPPPNKTLKAIAFKKELAKKKEAEETQREIAAFEKQLSHTLAHAEGDKEADEEVAAYLNQKPTEKPTAEMMALAKPTINDEYISKIRKRLQEDGVARKEREKRRRKVLVDQLQAHEALEDARREELLVTRLMRQSQQERRIATQLLQLRHEKAVIQQNRILREQQYEERRQKDFQEALDREAELARLAKLEYIEQTKRDKELHDKIATQRAEAKYRKHYNTCFDILMDIVDFSCKVGKYRELTAKLLPPKLMREWKLLFTSGKPLYESTDQLKIQDGAAPTEDSATEAERQRILDEGDFMEYKNMVGEWQPPEDCEIKGPPGNNAVLGHVLARLFSIVSPPTPPPNAPEMPAFPVKACFLGKAFAGKTSVANKIAQEHGLAVLDVDTLVREAIDAHKAGEVVELPDLTSPEATPSTDSATTDKASKPRVTISLDNIKPAESTHDGKDEKPTQDNDQVAPPTSDLLNTDDNREKADDEKSVGSRMDGDEADAKSVKKARVKSSKANATPRAKLGKLASKFVRKGQAIKDELLVEIMVEAVKRVRDQQGWIMDGFPTTIAQAKLLEKALTGYDANAKPPKEKLKKSRLAPDPQPPKDPPPPVSGIDVVVLFDVPDELALRRAAGRTYGSNTGEEFQQEFKSPPEGSATGVGKQERVLSVKDAAHDQEQIQHRLTGFADSWKKLDKWYTGFGILQKLDVSLEKDEAYDRVHNLMLDTRDKIQKAKDDALKKDEPEEKPPTESGETSEGQSTQPTDGLESTATQVGDPQGVGDIPMSEDTHGVVSPKGSRAGSAKKRGGSAKRKGSPDKSPKREGSPRGREKSPKGERKRSESGSPKRSSSKGGKRGSKSGSPKRKKSPKRRTPTPEPEPEPAPPEPTGPPPPQPGSEDWVWVEEPIDENLAHALAPHWDNTESTYISGSKHVFRNIRLEREDIYHYFHTIWVNFEDYLRRPDTKQEFLAAWQQDYNEIAEDMRDDEETKGELHQRVMDLKEQLWEISDNRKLEAENERQSVMEEGWLEDRLGLLTNHYLTLMQSEVDRYQDTLRLLKDYYQGMEGKIPEEFDPAFVRIPLIDLATPTERPPSDLKSPSESNTRAVTPTAPTPSAKGKKGKDHVEELKIEEDEEEKPKIPLVPRRPRSTEGFFPIQTPAGNKPEKGSKSRAGKKDKQKEPAPTASVEDNQESPLPPSDPDEKLIHDAFTFGIMKVSEMTAAELAAKEAEDEAEKQKDSADKDKDKGKKAAKKRSKSKSPSGKKSPGGKKTPKKGKKAATPTPPPTPPPVEYSPEEQAKRDLKEKMKQEYMSAILHEESGLKSRMELIKIHTIEVLQSLKAKADDTYKDMDDWLGARFQSEMTSIDTVCGVIGQCIEKREKIKNELVSFQNEFKINKEVKIFCTPSPPLRPSPIEQATADTFTVHQIQILHDQFKRSAPTGFISSRGFIDTLSDLTALTHGTEALPDIWMKLTPTQLDHLAGSLSPDSEYIDWRTFLLQAAQPWPQPSQAQLLETLQKFHDTDTYSTGMITKEQYELVELWYKADSRIPTPDDQSASIPFDRTTRIQQLFFDIFADGTYEPPLLNYKNMLLYFSIASSAMNGFFRALSVAANCHMPRPKAPEEPELDPSHIESMKEAVESWKGEEITIPGKEPSASYIGPVEEQIPSTALSATVPLNALVQVFHHGQPTLGDSHRFSVTSDPEDTFSRERLAGVYRELGNEDLHPVPFFTLIEHPVIQDCLSMCHRYKAADIKAVLALTSAPPQTADNDAQSIMS